MALRDLSEKELIEAGRKFLEKREKYSGAKLSRDVYERFSKYCDKHYLKRYIQLSKVVDSWLKKQEEKEKNHNKEKGGLEDNG